MKGTSGVVVQREAAIEWSLVEVFHIDIDARRVPFYHRPFPTLSQSSRDTDYLVAPSPWHLGIWIVHGELPEA